MENLIKQIEQWAHERNIINGSKPIDQAMKLFSEFGELADNIGKGRDCRDDIGDIFVVLTIIAAQRKCDSVLKSCSGDYIKEVEWSENERPESINDLKDLVLMLNRDLHCLMMVLECYEATDEFSCCIDCLNQIATLSNTTLEECVQIAYNDIKDRKGIMSNGVFIKESDPAYASVLKSIEENFNVE